MHPAWSFDPGTVDPWVLASGNEVGDLCILEPAVVREAGFVATPVWSNAAAMLGSVNPCIPADTTTVFYDTSPTPPDVQFVDPGATVTFTLEGFSSAATTPWTLATNARGAFMPTMHLSSTQMNNGGTATLDVTVPATAPHRATTVVYVYSERSPMQYRIWPIVLMTN
jgi:hypothetical protein